jgi:hypothetical protein
MTSTDFCSKCFNSKVRYLNSKLYYIKLTLVFTLMYVWSHSQRLNKFSVMMVDDKMFYFTSSTTKRQLLEVLIIWKTQCDVCVDVRLVALVPKSST